MERLTNAEGVLDPEQAQGYRDPSARGSYLSQDRADISHSTKELCRDVSQPKRKSHSKLKRVGRYLVGRPWLLYHYEFGHKHTGADTTIEVYSDTDFAGCKETRKSTSGGVIMIGGHTIRHWSRTQSTIALSSGEAEL